MDKYTVLVVDDDSTLRKYVRKQLEKNHLTVVEAASGYECLRLIVDHSIRIVVLDLLLPGMSGRETLKQIRRLSDVPVIILSQLNDEREITERLNDGADGYLPKPFSLEELTARIHAIVRRYATVGITWFKKPKRRPKSIHFMRKKPVKKHKPETIRSRSVTKSRT